MKVRIRYYRVIKGHGYWCPTPKMKALGLSIVRCGPDGPQAHAIAAEWNERWESLRIAAKKEPASAPIANDDARGYVYFLRSGDRIKIGFSTTPLERTSNLRTSMPEDYDLCLILKGTRKDEKRLHSRFGSYRRNGEWFVASRPIRMTIMRSAMAGHVVHDGDEKQFPGTDEAQKVETTPGKVSTSENGASA
ncbi:GIY-YIG nuclease family protein [Mesorhizobium sp. B2-8-5]|uniref:GIY-YIG nuclease family protein n=1 Tax=Mesorhizobium sp. B2-8-5 TaxID=2589903 RepID=UPI00112D0462|nr:GIY-YIG nuclease family protein [Mesorhizobium sp. B2-8-5]UCI23724.1 GIY-YIG nuclease family protein [Mesorhizobium sp. B2-8-5]